VPRDFEGEEEEEKEEKGLMLASSPGPSGVCNCCPVTSNWDSGCLIAAEWRAFANELRAPLLVPAFLCGF